MLKKLPGSVHRDDCPLGTRAKKGTAPGYREARETEASEKVQWKS
jgi:hypothetical protein